MSLTFEAIKEAINLARKANNLELMRHLLEAQQENLNMQAEIQELRTDNAQLRAVVETKRALAFELGAYWLRVEENVLDGPYCTRCYDDEGKLIRIKDPGSGYWCCPKCEHCVEAQPVRFKLVTRLGG